jgi:HEAT repeat protein
MSKAAFDAKLAAIDALRSAPADAQRDAALRKALADRNNYISAKAARVAGDVRSPVLVPDLLAAFDRFMSNPVKTDPQCWAKVAIITALSELGHEESEVYIRGLRHIQMEPVWGGQDDTAAALRANSALALAACRGISDLDALECLLEVLFDRDKTVRTETARAIARIDRRESALILRLRALAGDAEPEPLGAIYSAVLALEGKRGIPFVARFLDIGGDAAQEAALALGGTHEPAAFAALQAAVERAAEPPILRTLLTAIALTRLPEAINFLISQARAGSAYAVEALTAIPLTVDQRAQVDQLVSRRN